MAKKTEDAETGLPPGWVVKTSQSRNLPYYFNQALNDGKGKSSWEPPENTDTEKLKIFMTKHYGKIRASHILVKHAGSRRPASWREDPITRTKEQAIEILRGFQKEIQDYHDTQVGRDFAAIASTESDCNSHKEGGQLGYFGKGQMQKEFEEAAFALDPGNMSGIVETASGVHLIRRDE